MKNLRKDNKGFSLVELIVVVLIMAIIAVALAPQVLKWVNRSRVATDFTLAGNIVTATQEALTNETIYSEVTKLAEAKRTFTCTKASGVSLGSDLSGIAGLSTRLADTLGVDSLADAKVKSDLSDITFTISSKGKVDYVVHAKSGASITSPDDAEK